MSVVGWLVVLRTVQIVRKVLLGGNMMRLIVGVEVPVAMAQSLRTGIVRVTQMLRYRSPTSSTHVAIARSIAK